MTCYLGIDGGGTKTAFVLLDLDDPTGPVSLLASHLAPGCYYFGAAEGVGLVGRVIADGLAAVCAAAGRSPDDVAYAFAGLPGWGEHPADEPALRQQVRTALGHDRFACGNDAVCGWAGSLRLADGINVVAGTGSIAYGRRGDRGARVGGWGELFGDEGSGYWIAVAGLRAASEMADGRRPSGPLLDAVSARLRVHDPLEISGVIHEDWAGDRARIAALAPVVAAAAEAGDAAAAGVLRSAGEHLAAHVTAARDRLGFAAGDRVPVSYSGGVFNADGVRRAFVTCLAGSYELIEPADPPAIGAARWAARLAQG